MRNQSTTVREEKQQRQEQLHVPRPPRITLQLHIISKKNLELQLHVLVFLLTYAISCVPAAPLSVYRFSLLCSAFSAYNCRFLLLVASSLPEFNKYAKPVKITLDDVRDALGLLPRPAVPLPQLRRLSQRISPLALHYRLVL